MHHQAGVNFDNFTEVKFQDILLTGTVPAMRQGYKLFQQDFNFIWKEYGAPLASGPRA